MMRAARTHGTTIRKVRLDDRSDVALEVTTEDSR